MQTEFSAPWGAIFDWDGVIIDSSNHHEASWERLAREETLALPEGHFKAGFGRKNDYMQLLEIVKIDAAASNGVRDGRRA